jgi:hypothetical protein
MQPDETPRQLGEDDELPDDLGSRIGDTLTFSGSGSYIRAISADEARRRLAPLGAAAPLPLKGLWPAVTPMPKARRGPPPGAGGLT